MMTCRICSHPERAQIDRAIVEQRSLRDIASQFDVHRSSLDRHKKHIPKTLAKAKQAETVAESTSLLSRIERLTSRCEQFLDRAERTGELPGIGIAFRELRGYLELLAKLSGELQSGGARVAINIAAIQALDIGSLSAEQVGALYDRIQEERLREIQGMSDEELQNHLEELLRRSFVHDCVKESSLFDKETIPGPQNGHIAWTQTRSYGWTPYLNAAPSDRFRMLQAAWRRLTGVELPAEIRSEDLGPAAAISIVFDLADPRQQSCYTWPKVSLMKAGMPLVTEDSAPSPAGLLEAPSDPRV